MTMVVMLLMMAMEVKLLQMTMVVKLLKMTKFWMLKVLRSVLARFMANLVGADLARSKELAIIRTSVMSIDCFLIWNTSIVET